MLWVSITLTVDVIVNIVALGPSRNAMIRSQPARSHSRRHLARYKGETYENVVKLAFAKGASLRPAIHSSLSTEGARKLWKTMA
jgi:hypothetical protein